MSQKRESDRDRRGRLTAIVAALFFLQLFQKRMEKREDFVKISLVFGVDSCYNEENNKRRCRYE